MFGYRQDYKGNYWYVLRDGVFTRRGFYATVDKASPFCYNNGRAKEGGRL